MRGISGIVARRLRAHDAGAGLRRERTRRVKRILLIGCAGALGTLCRYGLGGWVSRWAPSSFPWGTVTVNGLGSFLFGFVWILAERRIGLSPEARIFVLTGFMGAFTTFSTYMFETGQMLRDAQWLPACANVMGQVMLGLVLLFAGMALARNL